MRTKLFILGIVVILLLPLVASATDASVGKTENGFPRLTFHLGIPGSHSADEGPAGLVANLYEFAIFIAGFLAFGSIVYGAIMYLANPGSSEAQSAARGRIRDALIGLLLLLGIYFMLNLLDPNLTNLRFPTMLRLAEEEIPTVGGYVCKENGQQTACYTSSDCGGKCAPEKCVQETCNITPAGTAYACVPFGLSADAVKAQPGVIKKCYPTQDNCFKDSAGCPSPGTINDCVAVEGSVCAQSPGAATCASGGCQVIPLPWQFKNGNQADAVAVQMLQCMAGKGIELRITEAMPASSPHKSRRHTNGCAIDATLVKPAITSAAQCDNVCTVIQAARDCGAVSAWNEYFRTCATASCTGLNTELSTGEHVHINANCGL